MQEYVEITTPLDLTCAECRHGTSNVVQTLRLVGATQDGHGTVQPVLDLALGKADVRIECANPDCGRTVRFDAQPFATDFESPPGPPAGLDRQSGVSY
jgi:hypothetical protein